MINIVRNDEDCEYIFDDTRKITPVRLYLPEAFDPADVLPKTLEYYADHARYMVSSVYQRRVFDRRAEDDFLYLHSGILLKVVGKKYKEIRDVLEGSNVLEVNHTYKTGEHSMGYRLNNDLRHRRHRVHHVANPKLTARIHEQRRSSRPTFDVHKYLFDSLHQTNIAFRDIVPHEHEPEAMANAAMIFHQDYHFTVCQYGRVHTNLSNLKRDLRKYLRVNDLPLVNVDIANSQPLFFGVLLLNWYANKQQNLDSLYCFSLNSFQESLYYDFPSSFFQKSPNTYNSISSIQPNSPSIPYVYPLGEALGLEKDVQQYLSLVQSGKLYEHLMNLANINPQERQEYKKTFFGKVFFCKNQSNYPEQEVFGKEFPNVLKIIREMKQRDYTELPRLLQKVESSLVVNRVIRRLTELHPAGWFNTIHDSVLCLPEHASDVQTVLRQEFQRFGLQPTLRTESY